MRYFVVVLFILSSCGDKKHDPVEGKFWAISTLSKVNGDCGSSTKETGTQMGELWTINKTEDDTYTLTLTDENQNSVVFSTSQDGYVFQNRVDGPILDCMFHIVWTTELEYTDDTIEGTHTNTLTMDCAAGVCEEVWKVSGTKVE